MCSFHYKMVCWLWFLCFLQSASCLLGVVIVKRNNWIAPLYTAVPKQGKFLRRCLTQLKPHLPGLYLFSRCPVKASDLSDCSTGQGPQEATKNAVFRQEFSSLALWGDPAATSHHKKFPAANPCSSVSHREGPWRQTLGSPDSVGLVYNLNWNISW